MMSTDVLVGSLLMLIGILIGWALALATINTAIKDYKLKE